MRQQSILFTSVMQNHRNIIVWLIDNELERYAI